MALNLYSAPEETKGFVELDPFRVTFDGRQGGAIATKIFLRNDDPSRWYSNMVLQALDTSTSRKSMVTEGVPGFFWKLAQGDRALFPEEWDQIAKGNSISFTQTLGSSTFGDITTYLPVWVYVQILPQTPISTIKEIVLKITAKENYVSG